MTKQEIKEFLDLKADQFENPDFLENDPIQIVHQFERKEDIEIIGLLIATIAWGNRKSIINNGKLLCEIFGHEPFEFIKNHHESDLRDLKFVHRTFNTEDLKFFIQKLHHIYKESNLEQLFSTNIEIAGVKGRIFNFRKSFLGEEISRTSKHVSNPMKNSAAKRLNMYLRWMVRSSDKGVDFGIWKNIKSSELYMPLDVHTGNNIRRLKLVQRHQNDWMALEEIMKTLQKWCPEDPVKYDFALFGLGAIEKW